MLSENEGALSFLTEYYAKGNGNVVLLTGKRLVHGVGTARSVFFTADSDLFGRFACFEENNESLTVRCYAEKERADDAVRSSVTFVVTAEEEGLRISVTALHDMQICCHLSQGVKCEALGERRYRLTSPQSEVLYGSGEGRSYFDPAKKCLYVYPGRSTFFLSLPSSGKMPQKKEETHCDYVISALSKHDGGLLALGRRVSLSAYCHVLSYAIDRRDALAAFGRVRFLEGLYERYHALPSSFFGDGSEGELPQNAAMTEEVLLVLSRYVKAFGITPSDTLVAMAAEAMTLPISLQGIRASLFLVGDRIGRAARLRAVRRADTPDRSRKRKESHSC